MYKIVRLADLAMGILTKILQKLQKTRNMKKNIYEQTDKNCQYPTDAGWTCASKIDRTFHGLDTQTCIMCRHVIFEFGGMFCRAHKECTLRYYTCELWQRNR